MYVVLLKLRNKWSEIEPIGNISGNGFVDIINDECIKYINCLEGRGVHAKNSFDKPQNCLNYSLFYFEIKCKLEGYFFNWGKLMRIGLKNLNTNKYIYFTAKYASSVSEKEESFHTPTTFWNDNYILGCGLVYPPNNKMNEFPYIFLTKNGKQIGKGILLKDNFESYKLFVTLEGCSVEANFGNNLEIEPFKYDISNHLVVTEFY
ncbi:unnamed protein product [Meloidogyne enterolobii]|uniref:Uncharacterized protein n=1 Tax=Meloidogyne enterolobii TaxID=390850 RepID=A0ACB0YXS8_MELEN